MEEVERTLARVLVLEPNPAIRAALLSVLIAERYQVEAVDSLGEALGRTDDNGRVVALIAWQSMEGLLTEEHRPNLVELAARLKLVLMVPRRWARLLEQTDLGGAIAGLIPKPVDVEELLHTLQRVAPSPVDA